MAGPKKKDRLSPPLMYAFRSAYDAGDAKTKLDLRDESGERIIASRRTSVRTAITEPTLRKEVARDLESLMNAIAMESTVDMIPFVHARHSIINFGFPDITHRTIDENSNEDIRDEIKAVLGRYEPRLDPASVRVSRDGNVDEADLRVRYIVRADLICAPLNVPVEFVADVERDSGIVTVARL